MRTADKTIYSTVSKYETGGSLGVGEKGNVAEMFKFTNRAHSFKKRKKINGNSQNCWTRGKNLRYGEEWSTLRAKYGIWNLNTDMAINKICHKKPIGNYFPYQDEKNEHADN